MPIEFINEDTTLADKGLMLLSNEEETIDLKLSMPRSTYFKLDPGKIRIVVDLSSVTTTGTQTITYSILYPRGPRGELLSSSITQKEPTVRSTTIEIGELFRKNVEIRCKVVGNVAEGYIAGTVRMLPETLEVRGQQIDIMQVSYAQVTLDIENASSTVVELLGFELYDFSDQLIRSNRIHPASESIQVTMPVMTVKEVPLTVEFVETPGSRLENVKWALTPIDTITLSGDASTMAAIDEIKLRSRQYAKRQLTWLRRDPSIHWFYWKKTKIAKKKGKKSHEKNRKPSGPVSPLCAPQSHERDGISRQRLPDARRHHGL